MHVCELVWCNCRVSFIINWIRGTTNIKVSFFKAESIFSCKESYSRSIQSIGEVKGTDLLSHGVIPIFVGGIHLELISSRGQTSKGPTEFLNTIKIKATSCHSIKGKCWLRMGTVRWGS